MIKLSVIVPVYNVEKYIAKCLESIMNQTLVDFECLIINDGTKDNSIEVAKTVVGNDNRFVFFDKENGGLSDARNYGIKKATGEYLCFVDSDDYIDRTTLEKAYEMAKKNDSDITVFDMYYEFDNGRLEVCADDFNVDSYKNNKDLIYINNSANNKIFRRKFIEEKEFIKGWWYEDLATVPIWLAQANNVSRTPEPLYYYVQREGSISHSANPKIFDIYLALSNIKEQLKLSSREISKLYFDNCLIMTTLRIKDIEEKKQRIEYFKHNVDLLDFYYPEWYKDAIKEKYSIKQKIMFSLLKFRMIRLLDKAFNR